MQFASNLKASNPFFSTSLLQLLLSTFVSGCRQTTLAYELWAPTCSCTFHISRMTRLKSNRLNQGFPTHNLLTGNIWLPMCTSHLRPSALLWAACSRSITTCAVMSHLTDSLLNTHTQLSSCPLRVLYTSLEGCHCNSVCSPCSSQKQYQLRHLTHPAAYRAIPVMSYMLLLPLAMKSLSNIGGICVCVCHTGITAGIITTLVLCVAFLQNKMEKWKAKAAKKSKSKNYLIDSLWAPKRKPHEHAICFPVALLLHGSCS